MSYTALLAAIILLVSGSAIAASVDVLQLDVTKPNFSQQQDSILKAINTDVNYGEISAENRVLLTKSLTSIADTLKASQSFASVPTEIQQQLLTAQKLVNETLLQVKKDSRMVCKKEPVLGSNFDKKVCRTAASLKRENDKVRDKASDGSAKIY